MDGDFELKMSIVENIIEIYRGYILMRQKIYIRINKY